MHQLFANSQVPQFRNETDSKQKKIKLKSKAKVQLSPLQNLSSFYEINPKNLGFEKKPPVKTQKSGVNSVFRKNKSTLKLAY